MTVRARPKTLSSSAVIHRFGWPVRSILPSRGTQSARKMAKMLRILRAGMVAVAAILAAGPGIAADPPLGSEFNGECVMGLALGKEIKTDCSVSTVYAGKTYCFGNTTARELFLKKPE